MMLVTVILVGLLVVLGLFFVVGYNGLVSLRNRVQNAYAQIEAQLKRRHDLIPNLVATVKGYAAHEAATLEAVTQARSAAMAATTPEASAQAETQLSQALFNLRAVAEAYPELKANESFLALQHELGETEDRITYARQFYNDTVNRYDTKRQSIPWNLVAGGFQGYPYFEADPDSRTPVTVQF